MNRPTGQQLVRNTTLTGDVRTVLPSLPADSIDTVVTSPPYFRLRDYASNTQIGLESTVEDWVGELRDTSREIGRVLAPHGTYWLNLGDAYSTHGREGTPRKSLLGAPERLLLALIEDGWIVRNKIVWAKPNPIPSSVTDRLACTYEVIYLLTRSPRYFFDLHAIRQPHRSSARATSPGLRRPSGRDDQTRPAWLGPNADGDQGLARLKRRGLPGHPLGKNPGDVWTMATSRYHGAHFATYPVTLIERILRAGCPEKRCTRCRRPWTRPLKRRGNHATRLNVRPSCDCDAVSEPGLVLDPFMGAGTTALAAERQGKDWLGIELNSDYVSLAEQRLADERNNKPKGGDHE